MRSGVNAWIFPKGTPIAQQARQAAEAGFAGLELCFDEAGEFSLETPEAQCRGFGACLRDAGLEPCSLATGLYWKYNFGDPDPVVRARAGEITLRGLDLAAWIGADVLLVVPAVVGKWDDPAIKVSYADALNRTHQALYDLTAEAECRGVAIGLENVWNRFLLSPVELRDLIDQIHSPLVGMYLDAGNVLPSGYPEDWVRILAERVLRVHLKDYDLARPGSDGFCPLGEGSVNWPAVMAALNEVGYDGPVIYEGGGDPHDARQRVDTILAMA